MMNVLIPTDFSENSRNAMKYALAYFNDVEVNFYILHVFPSTGPVALNAEQTLSDLLKEETAQCRALSKNPLHKFFPLLEKLNLVEAVRKHVSAKEIDYILMGTKGTTSMNGGDMGSNTCDVITKVKCPILVIPENGSFNGIKNIAFLTDYNGIYRNKIISRLSQTLDLHLSPLRVLHIKAQHTGLNAAQTDNKGFLHYFFKDKKHSFHVVENKDLEIGIQHFVETWDIGLVSIGAKNLNLIQRLLFRPFLTSGIHAANIPFLVLHE